ncbi:MAG: Uma2 family endonuclease, partial [Sphaerospermopsis kisseleviana]
FWLGNWQGILTRETATWLRFYDQQGNLVLLPDEAERQRANIAQEKADNERQRAENERQRAENERQRAENERQRAEQAEQARKEAIPKLLQMGLTVEQIAQALTLSIEEVQKVTEKLT